MFVVISGTRRKNSQSARMAALYAKELSSLGEANAVLDLVELPASCFSPEAFDQRPADFEPFNQMVLSSTGLIVVTPEYNGSFPGILKHFIDLLQFPQAFEKRPVAFCGLAAGMWGALRSVEQLQTIFGYRNAYVFPERLFLPKVQDQLDPTGNIKPGLSHDLFKAQVKNFCTFAKTLSKNGV